MPADKGPLGRWSRRKAAVRRQGGAAPVIPDAPSAVPAVAGETVSSADDVARAPAGPDSEGMPLSAEELAALDLPDIDSLGPDSDFTAFMKEGVPAYLRSLALRKLWISDPVLANLDGLVDYGGDYTYIKSGVFEAVKTVLASGDEDGTAAGQPEAQEDQPESTQAAEESGVDAGADGLDEDEHAATAEKPENQTDSADDGEDAKV